MTADQREGTPFVPSITLDEYEFNPDARQKFLEGLIETDEKEGYGKFLDYSRGRSDLITFFRTYPAYGPDSLLGHLILLISVQRNIDEKRHDRRNGFSGAEVRIMRKVSERIKEVAAGITLGTTPPENFAKDFSLVFYAHVGDTRRSRENRDRSLDEFMHTVDVLFPLAKRRIGE